MVLQTCTDNKQAFNQLAKMEQTLTIRQSIEQKGLICQQGDKVSVIRQIIRIVEYFLTITGKELESFQIQVLAGDLYEKFSTDTIEDIVLMLKKARQGDFGKLYRFDTFEMMNWANAYLEEKAKEREKIHYEQKTKENGARQESEGKYFHQLSKKVQERFRKMIKPLPEKAPFLPPKATEMMTEEKHRREIYKLIEADDKNNREK